MYRIVHHTLTMRPLYRVKIITRKLDNFKHFAETIQQYHVQFVQHAPNLWPPNSPDLDPVDYCVWSILQEKLYGTRFANIDELKCKLREWAKLDQEIIASAIRLYISRCRKMCEVASFKNFENSLTIVKVMTKTKVALFIWDTV